MIVVMRQILWEDKVLMLASSHSKEERDLFSILTKEMRYITVQRKQWYKLNVAIFQGFIATIPELIEGLDKIKNVMHQQRKITQAFGEAFDQCDSCG